MVASRSIASGAHYSRSVIARCAPYIQAKLGGDIAIGGHITTVQQTFGTIFNEDGGFRRDGSQFDRILHDGDTFAIGNLHAEAYHVPGHTPACMAYRVQDALFVGDTLFMPDAGTARCDFPGGDARALFASCRRLLSLPPKQKYTSATITSPMAAIWPLWRR